MKRLIAICLIILSLSVLLPGLCFSGSSSGYIISGESLLSGGGGTASGGYIIQDSALGQAFFKPVGIMSSFSYIADVLINGNPLQQGVKAVTASVGSGTGTISPSGIANVATGSTQDFTLTPGFGFLTAGASGTCGGAMINATTFRTNAVNGDCTVIATFERISYLVTAQPGNHGSVVCPSPLESGATATCSITPDVNFTVQSTNSSCGGSYNGTLEGGSFTTAALSANCSVSASFISVAPGTPYNLEIRTPTTRSSLTLTWNTPLDPVYAYSKVYRSTVSGQIGSQVGPNITTVSFTDSGLASSTRYYYMVRSVSIDGVESGTTLQVSNTTMSDVVPNTSEIGTLNITDTTLGGELLLSWNNPVSQYFAGVTIYRSTQSGSLGNQVAGGLLATYRDTGLTNDASYYYTIKTIDTFGQESSGVAGSQIPTNSVPPQPVTELRATLLAAGQVRLSWTRSSSGDIAYYNIYGDNKTGSIDYGISIGRIEHPATSWTSSTLEIGSAYRFALRSEDSSATVESNTDRVIGIQTVANPAPLTAVIPDAPKTGEIISGTNVSISARLNSGTAADITGVTFQYRPAAGGNWSDIANDTTVPYGASWNTSLLSEGTYHLRAVASGSNTIPVDENIFVTITVSSSATVSEQLNNASKQRIQTLQPTASAEIIMTGGDGKGTMRVAFKENNIITGGTVTITELTPASQAATIPASFGNPEVFRAISIGGSLQLEDKTTAVELPYRDDLGDGIVDGTSLRAADLKVCRYTAGSWNCLDSYLDTVNHRIRAYTTGFNNFALLVPPIPVGAGWNFVSIPLTPTSNTVASVFASATSYTAFTNRWDAVAQTWAPAITIAPKQGYLIWGSGVSGAKVTVTGTETVETPQTITLYKGWNLIGHPFRYRVNVADLTITYGGTTENLQNAQTNGWVAATAYKYAGGSYQYQTPSNGGSLEPWVAYWVLSDITCTLTIPNTQAQ